MSEIALSSVESKKSTYLWRINNFSRLERKFNRLVSEYVVSQILDMRSMTKLVKVLESPVFSVDPEDLKWSIVMFSITDHELSPNAEWDWQLPRYLCFKFLSKDPRFFSTDVSVKISIIKNNGEKVSYNGDFCIKRSEHEDSLNEGIIYTMEKISWFRENCCSKNELQILCEYEHIPDDQSNLQAPAFRTADRVVDLDKFEKLWDAKEFCDFKLIAPCGRKLYAHKFVLAAKSPVFFAMFKDDMREKKDNSVCIEDISYEALEKMLRFLYAGKVDEVDHESISGILHAAEKYEISDLKDLCKTFLLENLSTANALGTLKLCQLYHLTDLKSFVDGFIKLNPKAVLQQSTILKGDETDMYLQAINYLAEKA